MQYELFINIKTRVGEMTQWAKALITKPKNPSSIPRAHQLDIIGVMTNKKDSPRVPVDKAHESEHFPSLPGPASEGRLGLSLQLLKF